MTTINASLFRQMLLSGASSLKQHVSEINALNVFPIPDGDTGDNMLLTIMGGVTSAETEPAESVSEAARKAADAMLLSARGNSGVILSQFFDGIAAGLDGLNAANASQLAHALQSGVQRAYGAVLEPVEGTILTVARDAATYAEAQGGDSPEQVLFHFTEEAVRSLERTPELLPVLKQAGVVDSGGAGLLRIAEGMRLAAEGRPVPDESVPLHSAPNAAELDLNRFTEDSVLEFGYCTELLLRLQNAKTDVAAFRVETITDYLQTIGESVVSFRTGSVVKIHVHTKTPDKVLAFCQQFGEFLTVKIENMSLQHNNLDIPRPEKPKQERKPFAIVAAAPGAGIQNMFRELGADAIVDGGQSMNPSAADFLEAFDAVNANTIFVLPNNGNVLLTARQAAKLYKDADVRVLESKSLGEGHAALTMFAPEIGDADKIERQLTEAMQGVVTAAVSACSRDTEADGFSLYKGESIGFAGDRILSADHDRADAARRLLDAVGLDRKEICILIYGKDADAKETEAVCSYAAQKYPACELYQVNGEQEIFPYIFIIE